MSLSAATLYRRLVSALRRPAVEDGGRHRVGRQGTTPYQLAAPRRVWAPYWERSSDLGSGGVR